MRIGPAGFAILVGGAIAGALDIAYAISFAIYRGMGAERLLQVVASGALGDAAYEGGRTTAALGLLFHFLLSFAFAAGYWFASRRVPWLDRQVVLAGAGYGLLVFAIMNFIVLPLSAFPHEVRFSLLGTGTNLLSHMFLFGLPIAWAASAARRRAA